MDYKMTDYRTELLEIKIKELEKEVERLSLEKEHNKFTAEQDFFKSMVEQFPGIVLRILNNKIKIFNNKFEYITGYSELDFQDEEHLFKILFEENRIQINNLISDAETVKNPVNFEFKFKHKNGNELTLLLYGNIYYSSGNNNKWFDGIVFDITENKKKEIELKKEADELKLSNIQKDKFFLILAHDLKSPFHGLMGFTKILVDKHQNLDPPQIKHFLSNIYKIEINLLNLIENLLEWSRLNSGKIKFNTRVLFPDNIVKEIFLNLAGLSNPKSIKLISKIPSNLTINGDENIIATILQHFISNSIKFSKRNSEIILGAIEKENGIEIYVKDFGVGISKENLERLFKIEQHFSTHGTDNENGSGMGLLICKELIALHKGDIFVESTVNVGSKFSFFIPNLVPKNEQNGN